MLALTEVDEALRSNRVEAHEILAILALKEPNTREARHQLQEMGTLLGDDIKAAVSRTTTGTSDIYQCWRKRSKRRKPNFAQVLLCSPALHTIPPMKRNCTCFNAWRRQTWYCIGVDMTRLRAQRSLARRFLRLSR